ncbi:MAG: superinfection immunity protein [Candidatus Dormibacteria bacterium]
MALCALAAYFLPTKVAVRRNSPRVLAVVAIDTLLGLTVFGWVYAFALAMAGTERRVRAKHLARGCLLLIPISLFLAVGNVLWLGIPTP